MAGNFGRRGKCVILASVAVGALVPVVAQAQDATDAVAADDIVVTARRISERLQDVPVAITAIQGDKLASLGVQQITDLRQAVAGLNTTSSAGRFATPIYAIRGQRAADQLITQDTPIAVYIDDAVITPIAGSNLGIFDLENVQVLKGPQGTLFGRNTTGGAILFTTAKPTDRLEGSIKLGYGNYDAKTGTGVLNLPVSDAVRLRGAFDFTKTDGFGQVIAAPGSNPGPVVGARLSSRDEINLRLTAAIDPTDWLKTTTTGYWSRAKNGGPAFKVLGTPNPQGFVARIFGQAAFDAVTRTRALGPYNAENSYDSGTKIKIYGVINTVSIDLSDELTLKNIFSYRHSFLDDREDFDGTIIPFHDTGNVTWANSYSEEIQLQGKAFDDRLSYVFGIYYFDTKGEDGRGFHGLPGAPLLGQPTTQYVVIKNSSLSGFGQASFKLTDTLNLSAGLRYTVDRRQGDIISGNFPFTTCAFKDAAGTPFPIDQCIVENAKSFAQPSWLIGLDKKLSDDVLVYVTSRRSFRSGGFQGRANATGLARTSFQPESVTDLELGFKSTTDLGGWQLTANLAGYYQWYKDIQRPSNEVRDGAVGSIIVNAAAAKIYGGEAELRLRNGSRLELSLNYSYVKPKYDEFMVRVPVNGVSGVLDDYSNRDFGYIPRHQINGNVRLTPYDGDGGAVNLIANVYYQSQVVFSDDFQNREQIIRRLSPAAAAALPNDVFYGTNGYALVNGRAEWNDIAGSSLSAAVWVRNLFDKRYVDAAAVLLDSVGASYGVYGPPRTYGAEISFRF